LDCVGALAGEAGWVLTIDNQLETAFDSFLESHHTEIINQLAKAIWGSDGSGYRRQPAWTGCTQCGDTSQIQLRLRRGRVELYGYRPDWWNKGYAIVVAAAPLLRRIVSQLAPTHYNKLIRVDTESGAVTLNPYVIATVPQKDSEITFHLESAWCFLMLGTDTSSLIE